MKRTYGDRYTVIYTKALDQVVQICDERGVFPSCKVSRADWDDYMKVNVPAMSAYLLLVREHVHGIKRQKERS